MFIDRCLAKREILADEASLAGRRSILDDKNVTRRDPTSPDSLKERAWDPLDVREVEAAITVKMLAPEAGDLPRIGRDPTCGTRPALESNQHLLKRNDFHPSIPSNSFIPRWI